LEILGGKMDLKSLMKIQQEFDKRHGWGCPIDKNNIQELERLIVCLVGELGEVANIVKKVVRGSLLYDEVKEEIKEEFTDIFIYLMIVCNEMGIDLEMSYLRKLEKNENRFGRFARYLAVEASDKLEKCSLCSNEIGIRGIHDMIENKFYCVSCGEVVEKGGVK